MTSCLCIPTRVDTVSPPSVTPVSLAEAKLHLRIDVADDDALVTRLVDVATEQAEKYTGRAFVTRTLKAWYDGFAAILRLPYPPFLAISSIDYTDDAGNARTLASTEYQVRAESSWATVAPAYGKTWPATQDIYDAVSVTYTAGYGSNASDVPAAIRQAILMMVATMYEHREDLVVGLSATEIPATSRLLLANYAAAPMAFS